MRKLRYFAVAATMILVVGACSDDDSATTTSLLPSTAVPAITSAPVTSAAPSATARPDDSGRAIDAPVAAIVVDGGVSDWAGIDGLDMTLSDITGETVDSQDANVKVAHDNQYLYVLFSVPDDYGFDIDDHRFSPAVGVMWAIDPEAGSGMGATDDDQETSLGMVDIWHWELDCAAGEKQGGRVHAAGDGKPLGNDATCNLDDEYSTDPENREDDGHAGESGAENSLLGVWTHTNPVDGADGIWYFEMSRPLRTDDAQDAQFDLGGTALLALAFWDPDFGPDGWDDATHVVSAVEGWIQVTLLGG